MSKKNSNLVLVKPQSSLKKADRMNNVMQELEDEINSKGDLEHMHNDIAFVDYVCNLVENVTRVVLKGNEKRALVIKLITNKFPALRDPVEMERIGKSCDHLCSIGRVQKIATSTVLKKGLVGFLVKQLL